MEPISGCLDCLLEFRGLESPLDLTFLPFVVIRGSVIFFIAVSQMKLGYHCQDPGRLEIRSKAGTRERSQAMVGYICFAARVLQDQLGGSDVQSVLNQPGMLMKTAAEAGRRPCFTSAPSALPTVG